MIYSSGKRDKRWGVGRTAFYGAFILRQTRYLTFILIMSDHSSQMKWEGKIQIYGYGLIYQDCEVWKTEELKIL